MRKTSLIAILCLAAAPAAFAQGADAQSRYKAERAACTDGTSHQDRATCLREAGAALQESRRGGLTSSTDLQANALARCNAQPAGDREACRLRVESASSTQGSVEGGGIIRESTQTIPAGTAAP
ncbi:MAG: hypothetical protein ABW051_01810 [Burkholderiaceae bacterium]